jgi:Na+/proline symporter
MSNASGSLNSLAASSVIDLAVLRRRTVDPAKFLTISRRMTLVWGSVLILFGLVRWTHLLETGLTVSSFPFGSLLGLFLLGTFDPRANARGSLTGMFAGLATVLAVYGYTQIAFTWYWLIGACVTVSVGAVVSRALPAQAGSS